MKKCFIVLCSLLLTAGTLQAEVVRLDPVVVTATRTGTPLSQIASSVTVITAEEIEAKQQPLVIDLLRSVPGVYVARNGGPGGTTSIYLRGTDNKHTLVMIDGVELGDPSSIGADTNLSILSTINIERIEVVRGAQSVLYGSDAIGGVINIITKKGSKQPTGYVSIEGGSFNTWIGKGGFSVAKEGGFLSFSASNSSSDGFSSANENNGYTEADGYKNTSFSMNGGARPSDLFEINISANYSDSEYDIDGFVWGVDHPVDADEIAFTNTFSGHIEGIFHLLQDRWKLQIGSSLTKIDRDYPDSSWAKAFNGKKTKFELGNHFTLNSQHTLVLGAETESETAESDSATDEDATTNAFYLQDEFISGSFNATIGIRHDRHDNFGSETTWRLSSGYSLAATETRLKGSVGTGFKAPSLYQLFDSYSGNQDLKAETSLGYDIGIEQGMFDNSLIIQVTWFHNDIDDYIEWDGTYQNAGDIITQGVETSLELYPAEFVDLRLNYTYTDTEDKDNNRLLLRPLHTGSFDLNFRFLEDKMVNFNLLYVGERDDRSETLDDYILVNLAASHQITTNLKGFVRIDNLFDEDYEEFAGYGTAGLSGYAGVKLSF